MYRALAVILALVLLPACARVGAPQPERHPVAGVIRAVDAEAHTVTVSHEPIPGYMDAMTMTLAVEPSFDLRTITIGDRITATLAVAGNRSYLEGLERVEPGDNVASLLAADPAIGEAAAQFSLVDQDGKVTRSGDFRGKVLVITFVYTRCPLPDFCKLMSDRFAELERSLRASPELYERTHLLSISIDPERDDPETLKGYAARVMQPDTPRFEHWSFATGQPYEVRRVATSFGLEYESQSGQIVHSLRTAVIDPGGRLAALLRGNKWTGAELETAVRAAALPPEGQ